MENAKSKRIMIVEDDEPLAHLMKMELESQGFEVHTENRGRPAITYAADHPLDLVILDLRLPDTSGLEVAKELRRVYNPWVLPIVMLTALNQPIDQLRGFAHGAAAYLTKPCEAEELLKTIDLLL